MNHSNSDELIYQDSNELDNTLFLIPPDHRFYCTNHGGLLNLPFMNLCQHIFCGKCCETLSSCPIDHFPMDTIEINQPLKDEFDKLLCHCKYGVVRNSNGVLENKINGCPCLITYGSKSTHESTCKYNPSNLKRSPGNQIKKTSPYETSPVMSDDLDFYEMIHTSGELVQNDTGFLDSDFSSPSTASFPTSPEESNTPCTTSTTTSPVFNYPTKSTPLLPKSSMNPLASTTTTTTTTTTTSTNTSPKSSSSPSKVKLSPFGGSNKGSPKRTGKSPRLSPKTSPRLKPIFLQSKQGDYYDNNALWESSTQLFLCNVQCPNKEVGCTYTGKSDQDIKYHLDYECFTQKMKEKIQNLEKTLEKKDEEINNLLKTKKSTTDESNSGTNKNSQIIPISYVSKAFLLFFTLLKRGVRNGLKKLKKLFRSNTYNGPNPQYRKFTKVPVYN